MPSETMPRWHKDSFELKALRKTANVKKDTLTFLFLKAGGEKSM